MTRAWHNLAQRQAGRLGVLSVLMVALAWLGGCTGGPHPEPPDMQVVSGSGGSGSAAGDGGGPAMGAGGMSTTGGNSGSDGSGGTSGGSGGTSAGTGGSSSVQDGGSPGCDRDRDDMDAGTACDDDGGALH